MRYILFLVLFFINSIVFSQNENMELFEQIKELGENYTKSIVDGQIEGLRNSNPPKDTWTYPKLESYRKDMVLTSIVHGSFIMPNLNKKDNYSYNVFAIDSRNKSYYFVAIISFDVVDGKVRKNNGYLFTEELSLKDWWKSVHGFYSSQNIKDVPEEYLFYTCPPPPFID